MYGSDTSQGAVLAATGFAFAWGFVAIGVLAMAALTVWTIMGVIRKRRRDANSEETTSIDDMMDDR